MRVDRFLRGALRSSRDERGRYGHGRSIAGNLLDALARYSDTRESVLREGLSRCQGNGQDYCQDDAQREDRIDGVVKRAHKRTF